ncbi:hypothetical protein B0T10DRAFT_479253 [Thelonectria olida]|uniref:Uncharacterized protein n=1 Tax=Thelonectria olida TaxID=1576542 RepID=A0A9P8WCC1_9HYPO|nr:hypothetical protein B0T10DRAFT_479253 [Thelonectria olida]
MLFALEQKNARRSDKILLVEDGQNYAGLTLINCPKFNFIHHPFFTRLDDSLGTSLDQVSCNTLKMNRPSSFPACLVGVPLVFTGLFALRDPLAAHTLFGVPRPSPSPSTTVNNNISPFVYAKAVRDMALGLTCLGLHLQGNETSVTAVLAAAAFTGLGDG